MKMFKNEFGYRIGKFQLFVFKGCGNFREPVKFMEHFRIGAYTGKMIFCKKNLVIMLTDKRI